MNKHNIGDEIQVVGTIEDIREGESESKFARGDLVEMAGIKGIVLDCTGDYVVVLWSNKSMETINKESPNTKKTGLNVENGLDALFMGRKEK